MLRSRRSDTPARNGSSAIEDSSSGIRSADAAGMRVIAVPNRRYPPDEDALRLAAVVLGSIDELTADVVERG